MKMVMPMLGISLMFLASSCSDFFDPSTDDSINENEYISENTELYSGFIGLMTKMQAIGDKEILLTDTRAEFLEPTVNSTPEIHAVYNYVDNLKGNSYANPSSYYEVIIACNDYLGKVKEYRKQPQVNDDICKALISSTVRLKAWTYKTIGEIYGEAAWFDGDVKSINEFLNGGYEVLPMEQVVDRCLALMDNGYDGVPSNLIVDWVSWLDPANTINMPNSDFYEFLFMVPDYGGLYTELNLWKASYLDGSGDYESAKTYYKTAANVITATLDAYVSMTSPYLPVNRQYDALMASQGSDLIGSSPYWLPSAASPGAYPKIWYNKAPSRFEMATAIQYDYSNHQTNSLVKHFNSDAPAKYLLAPSEAGMQNFLDKTLNPGGSESDGRYKYLVSDNGGNKYMSKFRKNGGNGSVRTKAYEDDVHIYIYRATQYYLLLCEALNNLGRFVAADAIMNKGIKDSGFEEDVIFMDTLKIDSIIKVKDKLNIALSNPELSDEERISLGKSLNECTVNINRYNNVFAEWEGFNRNWTSSPDWLARKYYFTGLRGAYAATGISSRTMLTRNDASINVARRANDIQILKEVELELSCEGKTLPWMNRVAVRYRDLNIVADEICPKYEVTGKAGEIRGKILSGQNWVKYPLK